MSTVAETVKIKARLSRDGTTIASKTVSGVTAGVRALDSPSRARLPAAARA